MSSDMMTYPLCLGFSKPQETASGPTNPLTIQFSFALALIGTFTSVLRSDTPSTVSWGLRHVVVELGLDLAVWVALTHVKSEDQPLLHKIGQVVKPGIRGNLLAYSLLLPLVIWLGGGDGRRALVPSAIGLAWMGGTTLWAVYQPQSNAKGSGNFSGRGHKLGTRQ